MLAVALLAVVALGVVRSDPAFVLGLLLLAVVVGAVLKATERIFRRRRAIATGIPVRRVSWGRWVLRLLALGLLATAAILVVTRATVTFSLNSRVSPFICPTAWHWWHNGQPLGFRIGMALRHCGVVIANRWHAAWALGIGALVLFVASLLPSPYRDTIPQ
jgi:hypothetical protein